MSTQMRPYAKRATQQEATGSRWIIDCDGPMRCRPPRVGPLNCVIEVRVISVREGSDGGTWVVEDLRGRRHERPRNEIFRTEWNALSAAIIIALEQERQLRRHLATIERRLGFISVCHRPAPAIDEANASRRRQPGAASEKGDSAVIA